MVNYNLEQALDYSGMDIYANRIFTGVSSGGQISATHQPGTLLTGAGSTGATGATGPAGSTGSTGAQGPAGPAGASCSPFANVLTYASSGTTITNGTTDAYPAFASAITACATGGTIYAPTGTYNLSTGGLAIPSNCTFFGDGIDSTIIKSTAAFPNAVPIAIPMTMTGSGTNWTGTNTTYPINTPTIGATSFTTTTASDAGNFGVGSTAFLAGSTQNTSFWYPGWFATVTASNAGTGVVTLNESVPLSGNAGWSTAQKILSLPQNVHIHDMTIQSGTTAAIECQGGQNFLFENLKIVPGPSGVSSADVTFGVHKNSTFRRITMASGANPLELFVANNCTIDDCHMSSSYILVDGGSFDCVVSNCTVKDPQNNGSTYHGMDIAAYTERIKVIGNTVIGIPGSFVGINTHDTPDANRYHSLIGNTLIGANTTSTTGLNTGKGVVAGNMFRNLANGIQLESISDVIFEANYFGADVSTQLSTFSGTGIYRTRQNPTIQAMSGGTSNPTVAGGQFYTLTQGGAQSVSSMTGGSPGDEVSIILGDGNTTFISSGNFNLHLASNYNATAQSMITFVRQSGNTWNEKCRS